jgi:hypothetical protein
MSRTINGNLTGKAAQLDRLDTLDDQPTPSQDCGDALATLKAIDPGWERWYDDNVHDGPWGHIARQVWARVYELREKLADPRTAMELRSNDISRALKDSDWMDAEQLESLWQELDEIHTWLQKDDQAIGDYADARTCARFGEQL